jgi:hypothetical protein
MTTPSVLEEFAHKGSQRWLQIVVNRAPEVINGEIRTSIRAEPDAVVEWLSPITSEKYVEYRDEAFVQRLGLTLKTPLGSFWPSRGPMWDGLARIGEHRFLVETKAHIAEMVSGSSRASAEPKAVIEKALDAVRKVLAPRGEVEWSLWNGPFYQYANRLAHLHFLHENGGAPVHLVYIYFVHATDVGGPQTADEWKGAIKLVDVYMGLGQHRLQRFVHKVFIDVRAVCKAANVPMPTSSGAVA